jgi:hypothetical protein
MSASLLLFLCGFAVTGGAIYFINEEIIFKEVLKIALNVPRTENCYQLEETATFKITAAKRSSDAKILIESIKNNFDLKYQNRHKDVARIISCVFNNSHIFYDLKVNNIVITFNTTVLLVLEFESTPKTEEFKYSFQINASAVNQAMSTITWYSNVIIASTFAVVFYFYSGVF